MSKDKTISDIYYDMGGYSSIIKTFKEAKQTDNSITLNDVKKWFSENITQTKQIKGYNSWIGNEAHEEYQIDLFFMNNEIGMAMIDTFSKYATVITLPSKRHEDLLSGLMEGFKTLGGKPKSIFTDAEGGLTEKSVQQWFKDENINFIITRTHAAIVERCIRTIKDMLNKRIEHTKNDWI